MVPWTCFTSSCNFCGRVCATTVNAGVCDQWPSLPLTGFGNEDVGETFFCAQGKVMKTNRCRYFTKVSLGHSGRESFSTDAALIYHLLVPLWFLLTLNHKTWCYVGLAFKSCTWTMRGIIVEGSRLFLATWHSFMCTDDVQHTGVFASCVQQNAATIAGIPSLDFWLNKYHGHKATAEGTMKRINLFCLNASDARYIQ